MNNNNDVDEEIIGLLSFGSRWRKKNRDKDESRDSRLSMTVFVFDDCAFPCHVKPSMAPSPGALRIGLNDIRINGHTGVRDGFCFFKNESLTYSFYFLLLFLYLFSHTYHEFDHLIHLSFRELLWCNSLIYVYANWSAAYDNEIIKKNNERPSQEEQLWRMLHFLYHLYHRFLLHFR